jgi:hypothetical protein
MAEPLNATFFAFRKREGALLVGASIMFSALFLLLLGAYLAISVMLTGQNLGDLMRVISDAESNPSAVEGVFSPSALIGLVLALLAFVFLVCILAASYEAACLRWLIRGEKKGVFGLSLDADTWRVYGIYWVWLIFGVVGLIAFFVFMAVVGAMLGALLGDAAVFVLPALFFVMPIYFTVRLAPAAATAVATRRFVFFEAWSVSSDRFWALFGAFFLLWLIFTILSTALTLGLLAWGLGGDGLQRLFAQAATDPSAFSAAADRAQLDLMMGASTTLGFWAVQFVSYLLSIVFYVALFGVNARAAQAALEEGKIEQEAA